MSQAPCHACFAVPSAPSVVQSWLVLPQSAALLVGLAVLWAAPAVVAETYVVTTTSDLSAGTCSAGGPCNLRQAINSANANAAVVDTISFDIPDDAGVPHVITLESALPGITDPVIIDGTTEPSWVPGTSGPGAPVVAVDADLFSSAFNFAAGTASQVGAHGSTIRGLSIYGAIGQQIFLDRVDGCTVEGNYIGLDPAGAVGFGGGHGVRILAGDGNTIGGSTASARNVISGNDLSGVHIVAQASDQADGNVVQGNYIGTDPAGSAIVLNAGGVLSNDLGVAAHGPNTLVEGNVISGNGTGVLSSNTQTVIRGNRIGTNAAGTAALGNTIHGIELGGALASDNVIGGPNEGDGNVIAANGQHGLFIDDIAIVGTIVLRNAIGTDPSGTVDFGNGGDGVRISGGSSQGQIGGSGPASGNIIAFNAGAGVAVHTAASQGNTIRHNRIFGNGGLGIDLTRTGTTPNGVTLNDGLIFADRPNGEIDYPVLSSASTPSATGTTINGTLALPDGTYTIDFYASPLADPTGYGEGAFYLGSHTVVVSGGSGSFGASVTTPALGGRAVSATTTDALGNTSEMAQVVIDGGPPAVLVADASVVEGDPGATVTLAFPLTLTAAAGADIVVRYSTVAGTATSSPPADYVHVNNVPVTIPAGQTSGVLNVSVVEDLLAESNETFSVVVNSVTNAIVGDGTAVGTLIDDEDQITISIGDASVVEGDTASQNVLLQFPLTLSGVSTKPVTLRYSTTAGTASGTDDYTHVNNVLITIPAGEQEWFANVAVLEDLVVESDETLTVTISQPQNAYLGADTALGTIVDDEDDVAISIGDVSVVEGDTSGQDVRLLFPLTLTGVSTKPVTVRYTTAQGTATQTVDYVHINNLTITIPAGETEWFAEVAVVEDLIVEDDEALTVTISQPGNAVIGTAVATGTIEDDEDDIELSIGNASVLEGDTSADNVLLRFPLTLNAPGTKDITVRYTTTAGTASSNNDYTHVNNLTITIPPGVTSWFADVAIIEDLQVEPHESLTVTLSTPGNARLVGATAEGTILNDEDTGTISIGDALVVEGDTAADDMRLEFPVTLSAPANKQVRVRYVTSAGSASANNDYVHASNLFLTIPAGQTSAVIEVSIIEDLIVELDETLTVTLHSPENTSIGDGVGDGLIVNDEDDVTVSVAGASVVEGDTATDDVRLQFPVTLSAPANKQVRVRYVTTGVTATASADYVHVSNEFLVIPAGQTSVIAEVQIIEDLMVELDETLTVTLHSPENANLGITTATGTILNNEDNLVVSIGPASVLEGNTASENVLLRFPVSLDGVPTKQVTVRYSTTAGTATGSADFTPLANQVLTIPAGATSGFADVAIVEDTTNEANETLTVTLSSPTNALLGTASAVGTILNDDAPGLSINDVTLPEGNSLVPADRTEFVFTVTLSAASVQTITVNYDLIEGGGPAFPATVGVDVESLSGSLTFDPGQTTRTITAPAIPDHDWEQSEYFRVVLSSPDNATLTDASGLGYIQNDDWSVAFTNPSLTEGHEGTQLATIVLTPVNCVTACSTHPITVSYQTVDFTASADSDYVMASGSIVIDPTATNPAVDLSVTVNGDILFEANEALHVTLAADTASVNGPQATITILNDDVTFSILDTAHAEGDSATTDFAITVALSDPFPLPLSVDWSTTGTGSACSGTGCGPAGPDYVHPTSGTLTIPADTVSGTLVVPVFGDPVDEADESFDIQLSNASTGPGGIQDGFAIIGILDDDPPPNVSILDASAVEGDSGVALMVFSVELERESTRTISVDWATAAGTATAGVDYITSNGFVTFSAGQTSRTFSVAVNGDNDVEANETFTVNLSAPSHATIGDGEAVGTILDDDMATLSVGDATVGEGDGNAVVTVSLAVPSALEVSFDYATVDGSAVAGEDYTTSMGSGSIPAGSTSTTVVVAITDDALDELDEAFLVLVDNVANATLADGEGLGTILDDDDPPTININNASVSEADESATFTVSLSGASGRVVTAGYVTADGTATAGEDYTATSGTLTFQPGEVTQTLDVPILDDLLDEADSEDFLVQLSDLVNATLGNGQGTGTILDDDGTPSISISDATATEADGVDAEAVFVVTLSNPSVTDITVAFTTADGSATAPADYESTTGNLTIPAGSTGATIGVPVSDDAVYEADETFLVQLDAPTGATLADGQAIGTIASDDAPPEVAILDTDTDEGDVGLQAVPIEVVLLGNETELPVVLRVVLVDGTAIGNEDFLDLDTTITLAPGDREAMVDAEVVGDLLYEPDEVFEAQIVEAVGATIVQGVAVVTIWDDDPAPLVTVGDVSADEGNSGTTDFAFPVTLSATGGVPIHIHLATADGTALAGEDYAPLDLMLEVLPGDTLTVNVSVTVFGDEVPEPDEAFYLRVLDATHAVIGDGEGVATIVNDDIVDNQPPLARPDGYVVPSALSGPRPFTVEAAEGVLSNDADSDGDVLQALVVTPPPMGSFVFHGGGAFTYVAPANFHGDVEVTYRATDGAAVSNVATIRLAVVAARPIDGGGDYDEEAFVFPLEDAATEPWLAADGFAGCTPAEFHDAWTTQARTGVPSVPFGPDVYLPGVADGPLLDAAFAITGTNVSGCEEIRAYYEVVDADATALRVNFILGAWYAAAFAADPGEAGFEVWLRSDSGMGFGAPIPLTTVTTGPSLLVPPLAGAVDGASPAYQVVGDSGLIGGAWPVGTLFELSFDAAWLGDNDGWIFGHNWLALETVVNDNLPPEAHDDQFGVDQGGTLTANVLANDTDPEGDALTALPGELPAHAESFELAANGTFHYVHDCSTEPEDAFSYAASDGALVSDLADVTLVVTPIDALLAALAQDVQALQLPRLVRVGLTASLAVVRMLWRLTRNVTDAAAVLLMTQIVDVLHGILAVPGGQVVADLADQAEHILELMTRCSGFLGFRR